MVRISTPVFVYGVIYFDPKVGIFLNDAPS